MLGFGHFSRQGAKTPSSERKTLCHFDRREKSFLDPSHLLGMTDLGPSPLRLGVFAGDNPISAFAFFAPSAVNDPGPNPLWLRLRRAKFSVVNPCFPIWLRLCRAVILVHIRPDHRR